MSGVEEEEELKRSSVSNEFSVGYLHLSCFPMKLFMNANFEGLRQLDISYNSIVILPRELGKLQNLRSLWIHNNPILLLPIEIASLQKLEIVDMRNTKIAEVPLAIAVLKDLYDLDWRGTPMAYNLQSKYDIAPGDLQMLRDFLQKIHGREEIEKDFLDLLRNKKFVTESVSFANFDELINEAVGIISALFEDLADLRMFLRRADKFLPALLTDFTAVILEQSKSAFTKFQRDSQRTYLAADLEIKVRCRIAHVLKKRRRGHMMGLSYSFLLCTAQCCVVLCCVVLCCVVLCCVVLFSYLILSDLQQQLINCGG